MNEEKLIIGGRKMFYEHIKSSVEIEARRVLTEKEFYIISMALGLDGRDIVNHNRIAEAMDISDQRLSQLYRKSIQKLRRLSRYREAQIGITILEKSAKELLSLKEKAITLHDKLYKINYEIFSITHKEHSMEPPQEAEYFRDKRLEQEARTWKPTDPLSYSDLGVRAHNTLSRHDIMTINDLMKMKESSLRGLKGLGQQQFEEIKAFRDKIKDHCEVNYRWIE